MNIILLGAPGCGKGTQSKLICDEYNLTHISTGDLFRKIIANNTPLGQKIRPMMSSYIPDEIVVEILEDRLQNPDCEKGIVLDGFPRTLNQAQLLSKRIKIDKVINFKIDLQETKKRIEKRRVCINCGETFTVDTVGKTCPNCGGNITVREEDKKANERVEVYVSNHSPVLDYYSNLGLLYTVDVDKYNNYSVRHSINAVFEEIKKIMEG